MLGNNIKKARKLKGISINNLSKSTGIALGYLSDLENNKAKNPSLDKLKAIADFLEVSVKDLLTTDEQLEYSLDQFKKIRDLAANGLKGVDPYLCANLVSKISSEFENIKFSDSETTEIVDFIKYVISKRK